MNDIMVGDYVRTKDGIIIKADFIDFERLTLSQKGLGWDFENVKEMKDFIENEIVKHSPNIIDLIEVGDYVNGYRVEKIEDSYVYVDYCWDCELYTLVTNDSDNIKSIVTKEQMQSIEYRVEE